MKKGEPVHNAQECCRTHALNYAEFSYKRLKQEVENDKQLMNQQLSHSKDEAANAAAEVKLINWLTFCHEWSLVTGYRSIPAKVMVLKDEVAKIIAGAKILSVAVLKEAVFSCWAACYCQGQDGQDRVTQC